MNQLTESQRILGNSSESATVTDSDGRVLDLRPLSRRELMRCMRQWGQACNVEQWFALALLSATVRGVDGKPIPTPNTPDQVEAVADMLGSEGMDAVGKWYQERAEVDLSADKDAAKNSQRTPILSSVVG